MKESASAKTNAPTLCVVLPCYNESAALPHTLEVITERISLMKDSGMVSDHSYVLCVDDGSIDSTWDIIKSYHSQNSMVHGIRLSHNRGHQYALLAGLMAVREHCDAAISMDADLQDDPAVMEEMVRHFGDGCDIVYGVRRSRKSDSWLKRNTARCYYRLQRMMGVDIVYDHADYRLMSRRAMDILSEYGERNLYLRGIVPQIGLRSAEVCYDRGERVAGTTKYSAGKMLGLSIDGGTSFSTRPIRWIFLIGLILLIVDIAVAIYVLGSYFGGASVSGWSSIMLSLWFLGSLLLMALGIIGEYIGKIYIETKRRPRYNISERI